MIFLRRAEQSKMLSAIGIFGQISVENTKTRLIGNIEAPQDVDNPQGSYRKPLREPGPFSAAAGGGPGPAVQISIVELYITAISQPVITR